MGPLLLVRCSSFMVCWSVKHLGRDACFVLPIGHPLSSLSVEHQEEKGIPKHLQLYRMYVTVEVF